MPKSTSSAARRPPAATPPSTDRPRLNTIPETRRRLGNISHSKCYGLIKSGALRTVKIGRRRFASDSAIDEYIRRLESGEATP